MSAEKFQILIYYLKRHKIFQTVEVKRAQTGVPEILYDTLSSFSNQNDGGVMVFGLYEKDGFDVSGVDDVQTLQKKVMKQCNQMEPKVRAVFTVTEIDGKNIVSAEIPPLDISERPCFYQAKGRIKGSYVRVGDADIPMTEAKHPVPEFSAIHGEFCVCLKNQIVTLPDSTDRKTDILNFCKIPRSKKGNSGLLGGKFSIIWNKEICYSIG